MAILKIYLTTFKCPVHGNFENILNFIPNFSRYYRNIENVKIKTTKSGSEFDLYFINNLLFINILCSFVARYRLKNFFEISVSMALRKNH